MTKRLGPATIVVAAVVVVAFAAAASIAIDVHDVGGAREALSATGLEVSFLYFHFYRDGGLLELLQWPLLVALTISAGIRAGAFGGVDKIAARFWLATSVLAGLMVMEDAGNVRHHLADIGVHVLPMSDPMARTLVEVAFYAIIAIPALLAVWLYPRLDRAHRPPLRYALAGFVAYFAASVASATRVVGDWYVAAGYWVQRNLFRGDLPTMPDGYWGVADGADVTAFMVLDFIFEESVELLGASLLVAASLSVALPAAARVATCPDDVEEERRSGPRGPVEGASAGDVPSSRLE